MYLAEPQRTVRSSGALARGHARREMIPLQFAGIKAGAAPAGHRMIGKLRCAKFRMPANTPQPYEREGCSGPRAAQQQIRKALDAATRTIPGARWREDKALLDTVVNLTEWPSAILGSFDPEFLDLPEEVLVTVMRDHQKYFAVEDAQGKLAAAFPGGAEHRRRPGGLIRHGHERVLRARFNDARFFWQTDQKHPLRERVAVAKERHVSERPGQLPPEDAACATAM